MKKMTEKQFNKLKKFMFLGLKYKTIREIDDTSEATLSKVRKAHSLEDYFKITRGYYKKETTPITEVVSKAEEAKPETTIAYLQRIAIALEKMEVHWRTKCHN